MQAASIDLDDLPTDSRGDPGGMGRHIAAFPERIMQGWKEAGSLSLPDDYRDVRHVVVQGMGGSAIAGDIAAEAVHALREPGAAGPQIDIFRDYGAHHATGPASLVIIMSHSGRTEEALSGVTASRERGAKIIVMTGGGPLAQAARDGGIPIAMMPENGGPPRTYLPYALGAMLRIFVELGIAPHNTENALTDAIAELTMLQKDYAPACNRTEAGPVNPAKELARALSGRIPVIVSAHGLASAARRWKTQLNENAKTPAWTEELPEMHHNAVVGFEQPALSENLAVVLLGPAMADQRAVNDRYPISRDILTGLGVPAHWPELHGASALSRLLEAVLLGDYVSYYLALMSGIDPTPTMALDSIKARIRRDSRHNESGK